MRKNIIFVVLLVITLSLLNKASLEMTAWGFLATLILFAVYYSIWATVTLYKQENRLKRHNVSHEKAVQERELINEAKRKEEMKK